MEGERTPVDLREGVRDGIRSAIERDVELRGGRTARRLLSAGVVGVVGALGVTLLVSGHPFGHHPPWHVAVFSTVWSGLLVVSFAVAFLRVRTATLPLAHSAAVGILGLGAAGICGAICPDHHFLHWWTATGVGRSVTEAGGLAVSALCFGGVTTLVFAVVAVFLVPGEGGRARAASLLPAAALVLLLAPGVALQSVGTSMGVFGGWLAGTGVGACLGVLGGARLRARLRSQPGAE